MCSKILLSVSLLLGLSACSLVHDDPKASASLQSESTSLSCLKAAPTQARKLFAGEYTASKEDMNDAQALWSCLDVSLKYFAQFARGEDPNFYTAKELQAFANRFLPKGQPFTDGFTNSIFQLKSAIVGGDPTRLTQAEVSILRSKLSQFGEMIVPLAPYINTLIKSDSTVPTDPNARITARNNLRIFAGKLAIFFSQSPNNLAWSDLNTFVVELESYVGNQNHTFASAVSTLQLVTPVLIGEKGPALTPSDLQALINKGISIYLVWANQPSPHSTSDTLIAIGHSLDTLLSAPTFASLTETEIMSAYQNVQDFVTKVNPNPAKPIQWAKIRNYIAQGLAAKKILFQTPDNSLSSFDLTKLSILYQSFTSGSTLANDFESLQLALKTQGFLNAKIADLIPLVNAILPPDQSLESRGISQKIVEDLKAVFLGGDPTTIDTSEYPEIAFAISKYFQIIKPKVDALPSDFVFGLNSPTAALAASFIQTLETLKNPIGSEYIISVPALKTLMMDSFANSKFKVRESTVDALLIGLTTRVFHGSKDAKPLSVENLTISANTDQLGPFVALLLKMEADLKDVENAFQGVSDTTLVSKAELLKKLRNPNPILVLNGIQPIINPNTHAPQFGIRNQPRDLYSKEDLATKTAFYDILVFAFPYYHLEKDGDLMRLSLPDSVDLLTDINPAIYDFKLTFADDTPARSAKSKMSIINVFTRTGNGDQYLDLIETTEFLALTVSSKIVLKKIEDRIFPACAPGISPDAIKHMQYDCLTQNFFTPDFMQSVYGPSIPLLTDQYLVWNEAKRNAFRRAAFTATEANWEKTGTLLIDDFETLTSLPFYVENIFERFDGDQNDILNYQELMGAFPTFCGAIQPSGKPLTQRDRCDVADQAPITESIYAYLIFKGVPPLGKGNIVQTVAHAADFIAWEVYWSLLDKKNYAARNTSAPQLDRDDLIQIISNLATSVVGSAAQNNATPVTNP